MTQQSIGPQPLKATSPTKLKVELRVQNLKFRVVVDGSSGFPLMGLQGADWP